MSHPDQPDEHGRTTGGVRGAINDLLGRGDRTDDDRRTENERLGQERSDAARDAGTEAPTGARFDGQPADDRPAADPRPSAEPPAGTPTGARFEGQHADPRAAQATDPRLDQQPPTGARFEGQPTEQQHGRDLPGDHPGDVPGGVSDGPDAGSRTSGSSVVGAAAPEHRAGVGAPGSARHNDVGPDGPGYAPQARADQHLTDQHVADQHVTDRHVTDAGSGSAGARTVDVGGHGTADPAAATDRNGTPAGGTPAGSGAGTVAATSQGEDSEGRERLVSTDRAESYGSRWDAVKGEFVDEPRKAVADADALVGELLEELQTLFTKQRQGIERSLAADETSTEDMRLALRRYRSFFDRLLSI